MKRDLQGKAILITGASSGIGRATAMACAAAGMHVSMMARRESKLRDAASAVSVLGTKAHYFVGNVADPGAVRAWIDEADTALGRTDAVLANAGYGASIPVLDMTDADVRGMFDVNVHGTLHVLREALPYVMTTDGGLKHLLVTSSCLSELGPPGAGVYAATKAAQDSIAQALRAELAGEGVSVSSIHPVGTKTEFFDVAGEQGTPGSRMDPPEIFMQTPAHVAKRIVACLRRPKAEVWPMRTARVAAGLATVFPGVTAWGLRRGWAKQQRKAGR